MNIVEAYTKFNKQLIIFVSGLSGCGKTILAKKIASNFNLELIDQFNYYKKDYRVKVILPDGTEHINWSSNDAIDWNQFNSDIKKLKGKGIIVTGFALVEDKIKEKPDFHIHVSISKKNCFERRMKFLEKNKEKYPKEYKKIKSPSEKLKMNQLIYPYYLESTKRSKIDKFINANKYNQDEVWDKAWDVLIEYIQSRVKKLYFKWKEEHPDKNDKKKNNNEDSEFDRLVEESEDLDRKLKDGPIAFVELKTEWESESES